MRTEGCTQARYLGVVKSGQGEGIAVESAMDLVMLEKSEMRKLTKLAIGESLHVSACAQARWSSTYHFQ